MSSIFAYICTKTTADPYLPPASYDIRVLARDVSDAFVALSGGHRVVGQLVFYPVQKSVPFHLLCDGREVPKVAFPELYSFLGESQGAPIDPENFKLPDYVGAAAFTPATTAEPETVVNGTVSTPPPAIPPPNWYDQYGDADSGGRRLRQLEP